MSISLGFGRKRILRAVKLGIIKPDFYFSKNRLGFSRSRAEEIRSLLVSKIKKKGKKQIGLTEYRYTTFSADGGCFLQFRNGSKTVIQKTSSPINSTLAGIIFSRNGNRTRVKTRRVIDKCKVREKARAYAAKKWRNNSSHRFIHTLKARVGLAVKRAGARKAAKTESLLGCPVSDFKKYLESRFKPGMSWDNYGMFGWHVDHIIPCAAFDLTDSEQQKKCFHYTNLQPLFAKENWSKGDKIIFN